MSSLILISDLNCMEYRKLNMIGIRSCVSYIGTTEQPKILHVDRRGNMAKPVDETFNDPCSNAPVTEIATLNNPR
jgi:hypothetical protein